MGFFHHPLSDGRCLVCLAGSVIAQRTTAMPRQRVGPYECRLEISGVLFALDHFRSGEWPKAFYEFYDRPKLLPSGCRRAGAHLVAEPVVGQDFPQRYGSSPIGFRQDMERVAVILENYGQ